MILSSGYEYGSGYGQYYDLDENTVYESCHDEEELYMCHLEQEEQLMMYKENHHMLNEFFGRPFIFLFMILKKWLH